MKYLLLIFLILMMLPVKAVTYYVSTTGNDTWDGSQSKPFRTLRYASAVANSGDEIKITEGTYVENGMSIDSGINITGAGIDKTIIRSVSSFYYHPVTPGYSSEKYLLLLSGATGNQKLSGFTIDGDNKQLHGGIYIRNRSNVTIDNVKVINTNFNGIWLWDVNDSKITNTQIINSSWGSTGYCSGALNIGGIKNLEIDNLSIDESTGYGIKAIGPSGISKITNLNIHHSHVSVNPKGLWSGGKAPNIAIELLSVALVGCEIHNTYVDNTISLVSSTPSTGVQTIRIHDNIFDIKTRANGAGYSVELNIHDVEIDHNQFIGGTNGIVNWASSSKNWNIHHNSFEGLEGTYPGEMVRSQKSGLHNVKFYNNIVRFTGTQTMNIIGLYGGTSEQVDIQGNLMINNNTKYSYYPNSLIHLENGATIKQFTVNNNAFVKLPIGTVTGATYLNNSSLDIVDFEFSDFSVERAQLNAKNALLLDKLSRIKAIAEP